MLYTWNLLNIVNQLCQSKKKIQMGKKKEMVLGELKRMKLVGSLLHILLKISTQNGPKEYT